ncbi:endonuclease [Ectropis obliqua nucleopolyhedrovirus]|uniref:Endonuclease n=1 Tax=Ectropis obliqua nucleopolyhedrovirus TaxID=59376 RepID=A0EYZ1_9ABAC|nr:endonuclease [Ectropis obliqua nucleopolyhedrovirus]ABI35771.1 endonuclease [Ectropis obliqua nucleopolyhedrovirus]QWV59644.1 endonuclease [Ectropis obliqua nucleopolyhedrovirus]UYO72885.1 endonuclease [Ectropis obliqua nucleopolyhedrovirus]
MPSQRLYALYLIETEHGQLYAGIASDVKKRFRQHYRSAGSKFLRNKQINLVYFSPNFMCLSCALRIEKRVKRQSVTFKRKLIANKIDLNKWITISCRRNQCSPSDVHSI